MSQSPVLGEQSPEATYLNAWSQLATRIQRGQSFSGRERNCCFLNLKDGRFADVSSALQLDGIDDSRAIAVVDWDHDGDLDLWQANRTGPRLRYLRNDMPTDNSWITIQLVGNPRLGCPADAIGARAELHLLDTQDKSVVRTQTLVAGDGFLSQSSKWMHFGIGVNERIQKLVVHWPGSRDQEEWTDVEPKSRYRIQQGLESADKVAPRTAAKFAIRPPPSSSVTNDTARLWLSSTQDFTPQDFLDLSNRQWTTMDSPNHRLICLWASWCPNCMSELDRLNQHTSQLKQQKLDVFALSVESLEGGMEKGFQSASRVAGASDFQFPMGLAKPELVEQLDQIRNQLVYRQGDLPLPSSFLIDARGQLRVIYTGPVSVEQLSSDLKRLGVKDSKSLRDLAVPFAGRWSNELFVTNPIAIAGIYADENQIGDAREYLRRYLRTETDPLDGLSSPQPSESFSTSRPPSANSMKQRRRFADVHEFLGRLEKNEGNPTVAMKHFLRARDYYPRQVGAIIALAELQMEAQSWEDARRTLQSAHRLSPSDPRVSSKLGVVYLRLKQPGTAITQFEEALQIDPNNFPAANNLAWLRATHPDDGIRDGVSAIHWAKRAVTASDGRADAFDTLAAALAESGEFDQAVRAAQKAIEIAESNQAHALASRIRQRLARYRQQLPFRQE